uniref:Uncharacterized protein n=1 Tax=Micrurus carvalhoi TaxID=3147026 RepID=A0A2H6N2U9_9SAUR
MTLVPLGPFRQEKHRPESHTIADSEPSLTEVPLEVSVCLVTSKTIFYLPLVTLGHLWYLPLIMLGRLRSRLLRLDESLACLANSGYVILFLTFKAYGVPEPAGCP